MALTVPIVADTAGLVRGLGRAQGRLRTFGKVAAIAAGAAGVGAFVKTMQIGIEELRASQRVSAQTAAVLKSTGGAANVTAKQIDSLARSLEKKSMFDDEAIQSGANLLLTFTRIRNEAGKGNDIFNQTVQAMVDVSQAMGIDASTAAIQLGKAIQDPVRGVGQLRRVGVSFTEAQRDQVKALVESGKTMEAQKMILRELEIQFGGSALAASKTLDGALEGLRNQFNNVAGDLVAKFLPSLTNAGLKLVGFIGQFGKQPTLRAKIDFVIGAIRDAAGNAYRDLLAWWNTTRAIIEDNPANRLKITIAPSGRDQANAFARDLAAKLNESIDQFGFAVGQTLTRTIFGGARRGAAQQGQQTANSIVRSLIVNTAGLELGKRLVVAIFNGVRAELANVDFTAILNEWARSQIDIAGGIGFKIGQALIEGAKKAIRRGGGLANILTPAVREAVQAARGTLASMGGTLAGMVGDIIGGTSAGAVRAREIRAQQKKELAEREKARLENAVAQAETDEERKAAQQDLDDFILEQEAQRLEDQVEQDKAAANDKIANLIESFNAGEISAQKFATDLQGIIGEGPGEKLGKAFAGAFARELQGIINVANDIASIVGTDQPLTATAGGGVAETQRAENQRRYEEAKARHDAAIAKKREQIAFNRAIIDDEESSKEEKEKAKKRLKERRAELEKLLANPPKRSTFGLALGGILKRPTFVAGEAGKEAVIPLESGSAMRILRDAIGGGGGSTQVINLTVNAGLGTNPDELSQVIVNSIKRYEKRNGSVFQGPLVSVAANVSGATSTDSGATTFNRIRSLRSG